MRGMSWCAAVLAVFGGISTACAQSNVQGTYAKGQVFLRWELSTQPVVLTYDIYASVGAETDSGNMALVGRVFEQEAIGERMQRVLPGGTLRVPSSPTSYVTLSATQGAFAWTPHQVGTLYFAVVVHGDTAVTINNRVQVTFGYDPVNDPVQPHWQGTGATVGGYPSDVFMVWVDGRASVNDARPDFPVGANPQRGGVPHVFVVTRPRTPLPATPYPCVFSLHGGEGEYGVFRPGEPARESMSLELTNGIVVTPDDNLYYQRGPITTHAVTTWFGYAQALDPFTVQPRVDVPTTDTIVNYTSRRVFWFLDWLLSPESPYNVDPERVALIGHSAGSRGASHLSRQAPERFSAAILQSTLINYEDEDGANPVRGRFADNIRTNMRSPTTGQALTYREVQQQYTRLSTTKRDFVITRTYSGKRDENNAGGWTPAGRAELDAMNASQMGFAISWDEREHGVDKWSTDDDDATDDPAHCDPWPDAGQWIVPVKTHRHSAQYLADTYVVHQSYPGFFNVDLLPNVPGRQPDPGTGDVCNGGGSRWGTWGGYMDWDTSSIRETSLRWECTVFQRSGSGVSVDDSPVAVALADVAPRKLQAFAVAGGSVVNWRLASPLGTVQGQATADADGVVIVRGVSVPRWPLAARLILSTRTICVADVDDGSGAGTSDGGVTIDDLLYYLFLFSEGVSAADIDDGTGTGTLDGGVTIEDLLYFLERFGQGC